MRFTLLAALCAASTLLACGASEQQPVLVARAEAVTGADGTTHHIVECIYKATNCIKQAGKTCPNGYTVLERDGQVDTVEDAERSVVVWQGSSRARASSRQSREFTKGSMLIKCRPAAAMPEATSAQPATVGAQDR